MKNFEIIENEELEMIDGNGWKDFGRALGGTLVIAGGAGAIIAGHPIAGLGAISYGAHTIDKIGN